MKLAPKGAVLRSLMTIYVGYLRHAPRGPEAVPALLALQSSISRLRNEVQLKLPKGNNHEDS